MTPVPFYLQAHMCVYIIYIILTAALAVRKMLLHTSLPSRGRLVQPCRHFSWLRCHSTCRFMSAYSQQHWQPAKLPAHVITRSRAVKDNFSWLSYHSTCRIIICTLSSTSAVSNMLLHVPSSSQALSEGSPVAVSRGYSTILPAGLYWHTVRNMLLQMSSPGQGLSGAISHG